MGGSFGKYGPWFERPSETVKEAAIVVVETMAVVHQSDALSQVAVDSVLCRYNMQYELRSVYKLCSVHALCIIHRAVYI